MTEQLAEAEIGQTLRAAATVILNRNPLTVEIADKFEAVGPDGTVGKGAAAAEAWILTTLNAKPDAWATWFDRPENTKPAISMSVALNDNLRQQLELPAARRLLTVLDQASSDNGPAGAYRTSRVGESTIDLREQPTAAS